MFRNMMGSSDVMYSLTYSNQENLNLNKNNKRNVKGLELNHEEYVEKTKR